MVSKVVSLTHRPSLHQKMPLALISVRGWFDPQGRQWKIPMIPAGIEQVTLRFLAQHLNHCATAVSIVVEYNKCIKIKNLCMKLVKKRLSSLYTGSSKKMDGIWNRYNLKSTRRIYAFGILKCSEKFKGLDLPQYISICAPFVALETSKRNSISCHVFWILSRDTVSMADVILSCRCWIFLIFSPHTSLLPLWPWSWTFTV